MALAVLSRLVYSPAICFIIGFPYHHLFPRIIGHNLDNLLQGLKRLVSFQGSSAPKYATCDLFPPPGLGLRFSSPSPHGQSSSNLNMVEWGVNSNLIACVRKAYTPHIDLDCAVQCLCNVLSHCCVLICFSLGSSIASRNKRSIKSA